MSGCNNDSQGAAAPKLRFVQINLRHCKSASENLLVFMKSNNIDVSFIQEPWIHGNKVKGLKDGEYNLFYKVDKDIPTTFTCVLVRKSLHAFLLSNYSDDYTTTVRLEGNPNTLLLVSAYLPHDGDIPTESLQKVVTNCEGDKIFGVDANSRHTIWGSTECNKRGECLLDFINFNNLVISNRGSHHTFYFPSSDIISRI